MTLVVDRGGDDPRVHVLAIGVAEYRHLPGGAEPLGHDRFRLKQLDGPQHSARAFIEWADKKMNHPSAPLGTIEALSSPPLTYPGDDATAVDVPSLDNVKQAFDRWFERCDGHEENVAIFYFCGHGLEREAPFLLLEDFGKSRQRPLENAVKVGTTFQGMATCRAREQYFFADSCRDIPHEMSHLLYGDAAVLVVPKLVGDRRTGSALLLATGQGSKAFVKPGHVTRFTGALLRAFDGLGGRPAGHDWVVDIPGVQAALARLLREGRDGAPGQTPVLRDGNGAGVIHRLSEAPAVPVDIRCYPAAAVPAATVALTSVTTEAPAPSPSSYEFGWTTEAPADFYRLEVDFPNGGFRPHDSRFPAWPPGQDVRVEVGI